MGARMKKVVWAVMVVFLIFLILNLVGESGTPYRVEPHIG